MDYEAMLDWLIERRDDCRAVAQFDEAKMINAIIEIVRHKRDLDDVYKFLD